MTKRAVANTVLSACTLAALVSLVALAATGCAEREPLEPKTPIDVPPPCACAIAPARVEVTEGELAPAAPERPRGTRLRETVSLGYVGDGKLTESPRATRLWQGEDHSPMVGYGWGGGYGGGGYASGRGHGGSRGAVASGGGQPPRSNLIFTPHFHTPGQGSFAPNGRVGGGSRPTGGRGPR